jgi:hypothetical protein
VLTSHSTLFHEALEERGLDAWAAQSLDAHVAALNQIERESVRLDRRSVPLGGWAGGESGDESTTRSDESE